MPNSLLATARTLVRKAAQNLGYDDKLIEGFLRPEHEHSFKVKAGGQKYPAYRVQHNSKLGPYKGGIRFHPNVSLDEVRALALLMSLKTAAADLPLGGGKGGITVDPKSLSEAELEDISRDYARQLAPYIGSDKDIPAPDVNTNGQIMDWMVDELAKVKGQVDPGAFTGKSMNNGGSEGREAATGRGGVIVLSEFLKHHKLVDKQLTVALQGFGNVGYWFAKLLPAHPNLKLIAVADSQNTWLKTVGLDIDKHTQGNHKLAALTDLSSVQPLPSAAVVGVEADILVLAALEDAVTETNMKQVKASIVVEMANGPISKAAEDYLWRKKVQVLPDIIANAGGVAVSCFEWQQNLRHEHWSEAVVNGKLKDTMVQAANSMFNRAEAKQISLKEAAFELALMRLLG